MALNYAGQIPKGCKVVAFKESLNITKDVQLAERVDLIVCYVWQPKDWTFRNVKVRKGHLDTVRPKIMQVPWLCHDRVLDVLHKDGLTSAYLNDNVEAIRSKYAAAEHKRTIGFIGARLPHRSRIMAKVEGAFGFEIKRWAGGHDPSLTPGQYLRWLTECELSLNLEGDTYSCSRLAECAMMGAAVVQCRPERFAYTPPITAANAVLCDAWTNKEQILSGWPDAEQRAEGATQAYREGWSLRGQFQQMLRRLFG